MRKGVPPGGNEPVWGGHKKKVSKGVRRMPRLLEAKKDVLSCDKLR